MIHLLLSIPSRILDIIGDWLTPDLGPSREPSPEPIARTANGLVWSEFMKGEVA